VIHVFFLKQKRSSGIPGLRDLPFVSSGLGAEVAQRKLVFKKRIILNAPKILYLHTTLTRADMRRLGRNKLDEYQLQNCPTTIPQPRIASR